MKDRDPDQGTSQEERAHMFPETINLLMVEDTPAEAELVQIMLSEVRRVRYNVTHVERLSAGLDILRRRTPDVVLLDFNLPDSSGLETFRSVHSLAPHVPVIILTNLKDEEMAIYAVRQGAQDYLVKREVDSNLLSRAIRYAIERCGSERALRESEERYALAVNGANDGIWDWNLQSNSVHFSARWKSMQGYEPGEIGDDVNEWFDRIHPDDAPQFHAALSAHLEGKTEHFESEYRLRSKTGYYFWRLSRGLAVRDQGGRPYRMAGSLTDISSRKAAEEQLQREALYDSLTGLPNRALLIDRINRAMEVARRRPKAEFAVVYIDLDRFKIINDSLGHSVGDDLLVQVSERLGSLLRPGDTFARLVSDEFVLVLGDIGGLTEVTDFAEQILESIRKPFEVSAHEIRITASVGVAMYTRKYERAEEIIRDADIAMYRSKTAEGGRGYEIFNSEMHQSVVALLRLETDLRRAVERNEFVMYYQPIVILETGRITGFEALIRWQHPERGLLAPQSFITVAEETGVIVPIGWWALEQACVQLRNWHRQFPMTPPLSVSVNISGKVLNERDVVPKILALIQRHGLTPQNLRLEITENMIMDSGEISKGKLSELQKAGVKLNIDDFGTGYSSLSYLQNFKYDSLKIDKSFVGNLGKDANGLAIVQTIVGLASLLNMNVIAEGVETADQLRTLRDISCPQAQGFWFAEPMSISHADGLLAKQSLRVH